MAVTLNPVFPWQYVVTACAAASLVVLMLRYILSSISDRYVIFGSQTWKSLLILLGTALAAGSYSLAAWNPVILRVQSSAPPHLVVVIDVSQSSVNGTGGLEQLKKLTAQWLERSITDIPSEIASDATASLVVAASSASTLNSKMPISELPKAVQKINDRNLPIGSETNLAEGLKQARKQIEAYGGQGAVMLVTDGNETTGDALAVAEQLAQTGIPIHILPVSGGASSVYLAAADMPVQIAAREKTYLRCVIWNQLTTDMTAALEIKINPDSQEQGGRGEKIVVQSDVILPANKWSRLNIPLSFEGTGIQFVDLQMKIQEGDRENIIYRRFFIHVLESPRVLAIGGDNRWVGIFEPNELLIDFADSTQLGSETIFDNYDAVVLNSVEAQTFAGGLLEKLAVAVTKNGVGLLFVNGSHSPRIEEQPTVFSSYVGTAIEPILPVSIKPRDETQEPPARNIIMILDVSGSMEGDPLNKSKQVASFLVEKYLRSQDTLDLITFTQDAQHLIKSLPMTADGKQKAYGIINSIPVGGGTDPQMALDILSSLSVSNCGLIFLSDGEFSPIAVRPECRATIFDIGGNSVDPNFPLDFADPIPTPLDFEPASIPIPYFQPEIRKKFFEEGDFLPLRTPNSNPLAASLAFPDTLTLNGSAVTYVKQAADLIAVRPKLTDPILAFLTTDEGTVGAFASEFSPLWFGDASGKAAFRDWIMQTVAYSARDRYVFQVTDFGKNLRLCISVVSEDSTPPQLSGLGVSLKVDGVETSIPMSAEVTPGQFCGVSQLSERDFVKKATLIVAEKGMGALQKKQRIPFLLPPSRSVAQTLPSEAFSFGVNERLLRSIASAGDGVYDPPSGLALFTQRTEQTRANPLWPWLLLVGSIFYLTTILVRRINF